MSLSQNLKSGSRKQTLKRVEAGSCWTVWVQSSSAAVEMRKFAISASLWRVSTDHIFTMQRVVVNKLTDIPTPGTDCWGRRRSFGTWLQAAAVRGLYKYWTCEESHYGGRHQFLKGVRNVLEIVGAVETDQEGKELTDMKSCSARSESARRRIRLSAWQCRWLSWISKDVVYRLTVTGLF